MAQKLRTTAAVQRTEVGCPASMSRDLRPPVTAASWALMTSSDFCKHLHTHAQAHTHTYLKKEDFCLHSKHFDFIKSHL